MRTTASIRLGSTGSGGPVPFAQLLQPLKKPAIHQDEAAVQVEQMLRAGDGAGGAEERQRRHPMTILEVMASIRRRTIHRGRCFVWRLGLRRIAGTAADRTPDRRRHEPRVRAAAAAHDRRHLRPRQTGQLQRQPGTGDHLDRRHPLRVEPERARRRRLAESRRGDGIADAVVRPGKDGSGAGQASRRQRRRSAASLAFALAHLQRGTHRGGAAHCRRSLRVFIRGRAGGPAHRRSRRGRARLVQSRLQTGRVRSRQQPVRRRTSPPAAKPRSPRTARRRFSTAGSTGCTRKRSTGAARIAPTGGVPIRRGWRFCASTIRRCRPTPSWITFRTSRTSSSGTTRRRAIRIRS